MDVRLLIVLLFVIVYLLNYMVNKKFNYWKNKKVPYITPWPILGNYSKYILLQEYIGDVLRKLCHQFPDAPYFGAFFGTEPVLVLQSPEIIKTVLTKDFYYFNGREVSNYADKEVITKNIFFASNDKWKIARYTLAPLFSTIKMKNMFKLIEKCCYMFEDMLERETRISDKVVSKQLTARYTMDCITSCAFGIEANTMSNPDNNVFEAMAEEIFRPSKIREFKMILRGVWPSIFYGLGFKYFPNTIVAFFSNMLKSVLEKRNYKPSGRNDFIDLLLHIKESGVLTTESIRNAKTGLDKKIYMEINDDILVAQCFALFGAGFETSSTTLSFTLFELAKNQDAQKRAAEEVDNYLRRHSNKLDYNCVNELPYIEACIYEALRKYPVLATITREVMDDYTFPDGLHLDNGVRVHIPVYTINHNPDIFPEPEEFKPERFLSENRDSIKPYNFFPFGEGPRICVGKRFAKLQMLPGLITILKKYRVALAEGMPQTVTLESRTFVTQPKGMNLTFRFSQRDGWKQRTYVRSQV